MSSYIYYKFKSSLTQQTVTFEGSSLSVSDLRREIILRNGSKAVTCDYVILSTDEKELEERYLIPKYTSVMVKRVPPAKQMVIKKTTHVENFEKNDPYKSMRKVKDERLNINLTNLNCTEDEKIDILVELSSQISNKNKRLPMGKVPVTYICNKCKVGGHWTQECPGIKDKDGVYVPANKVKRPSGIPASFLTEVDSSTKNCYLSDDGRYVVNTLNYEALLKGKKDKIPFSKEENPPMLPLLDTKPKALLCDLCNDIYTSPMNTPCCKKTYCLNCVIDNIFDSGKATFHKCPCCNHSINVFDSLSENTFLANIIFEWKIKKLSKEDVEKLVKEIEEIKEEIKVEERDDEYEFDEILFSLPESTDKKHNVRNYNEVTKLTEVNNEELENNAALENGDKREELKHKKVYPKRVRSNERNNRRNEDRKRSRNKSGRRNRSRRRSRSRRKESERRYRRREYRNVSISKSRDLKEELNKRSEKYILPSSPERKDVIHREKGKDGRNDRNERRSLKNYNHQRSDKHNKETDISTKSSRSKDKNIITRKDDKYQRGRSRSRSYERIERRDKYKEKKVKKDSAYKIKYNITKEDERVQPSSNVAPFNDSTNNVEVSKDSRRSHRSHNKEKSGKSKKSKCSRRD